jgi:CRISPR-associated protein Cmr1
MTREMLRVTLETVAPLLLYGADGKTPELRPPAFRGAMRYWWRAALGSIIGDENLKGLHDLENAVFGSPERGSPISLRIGTSNTRETNAYLLPHKGTPREKIRRKAIEGDFELILSQPRHDDALVWDAARASLELALTFGGVGQRSRRGYGTLRIVEASDDKVKTFPTTRRGWVAHVKQTGARAVDTAAQFAIAYQVLPNRVKTLANYPCATNAGLIRLCDLQARSAMDAVKHFMAQVPKDDALGRIGRRRGSPRQASPLWVRPIQTGFSYSLLCTVLTSDFKGANYVFVKDFLDDKLPGEYLKVKGWNLWPKRS